MPSSWNLGNDIVAAGHRADTLSIQKELKIGLEKAQLQQMGLPINEDGRGLSLRGAPCGEAVAFLRREVQAPGVTFKFLIKEPLVAGQAIAWPPARRSYRRGDVHRDDPRGAGLKAVIDNYAARAGITLKPKYDAETLSLATASHRP